MKMEIKTSTLQEMVARAQRGALYSGEMPDTTLLCITLADGKLTLSTTDRHNYLYVIENGIKGDDMYVAVDVAKFSKLIARMTCDTIKIELKKNGLIVTGNGKYTVPVILDGEGEMATMDNPMDNLPKGFAKKKKSYELNMLTVSSILNNLKPSIDLTGTSGDECYSGYYMADSVIATNTRKVSKMDESVFDEARLLHHMTVTLLGVMMAEKITVDTFEDIVVFNTPDCVLYSTIMPEIEDFAIDAIEEYFNTDFKSMCTISKGALLHTLNRLMLFVSEVDLNLITLTFKKDGLQISSQASDGIEILAYKDSKKPKDFTCTINVQTLFTQVKALDGEEVEIWYGNDNLIKIVDGNISHAIGLGADEVDEIEVVDDVDDLEE